MITYYKGNDRTSICEISEPADGCWIRVIDPNEDDFQKITTLGIPQDFIASSLDLDERPRTEKEDDGTTLILIRIPIYENDNHDIPYATMPLGIIHNDKVVITICKRSNVILEELLTSKPRGISTAKKVRFILRILLLSAVKYLAYLRVINSKVEEIEDKLQASMRNKEVLELLKYQKSLVYFETALKSNELLLERLQKTAIFKKFDEDEDLLEDVLTEYQQAIEMVAIAENILSSTMDAFASIISNNLNVVMKFLASVTIVLSIPTIITGFFGMNVQIPWADARWSYLGIIGLLVTACLAVVLIFNKKDWF